jgi:serine/threonine protein phosphatase PrpC
MAEAIQKAEKEDTLLLSAEMDDTVEGEQTSTGNSVPDTSQTVGGSEGTTANVTLTEEVKPVENVQTGNLELCSRPVVGILCGVLIGCIVGFALSKVVKKILRYFKIKRMQIVTLQGQGSRENQEDCLAATDPKLYRQQGVLMCLADGMGGLRDGSLISHTAVSAVSSKFPTMDKEDPLHLVVGLVQSANSAVNMMVSPNYGAGGTTLLIGYVKDGQFYYASVGDSRICLYRNGKLIRLTRPHTLEEELIVHHVNGEISYEQVKGYNKNGALTSYLGMGKLKYADIPQYSIEIHRRDRFILMSDGIFNALSDEEIADVVRRNPKAISKTMNKKIQEKGARFQDNYSAVILIVG